MAEFADEPFLGAELRRRKGEGQRRSRGVLCLERTIVSTYYTMFDVLRSKLDNLSQSLIETATVHINKVLEITHSTRIDSLVIPHYYYHCCYCHRH